MLSLIICTVSVLCTAGVWIQQAPGLVVERGHSAQMGCSHTEPAYHHMYWFRQLPGESMELIVHTVPYEKIWDFGKFSQDKYSAIKTVPESGSLTVKNIQSDRNHTVTPPMVKVLQPSPNECQSNMDKKKKKKTLVCVASRFYPDDVSVSWQTDGVDVTEGVSTDNAALWGGGHYSITSRLRVPLSEWFTPGKEFTCTVSFFNGNETVRRSNWVEGVGGPGAAATRERYLRITHTATLSYVVLIVKSGVFGVFVGFMVWRLQTCAVMEV